MKSSTDDIYYSTEIEMWLDCEGFGTIPLSQASSTFVIAKTAQDVPPCDAVLIITVDGKRHERKIRVNGMTQDDPQASIASVDSFAPF